MIEKNSQCRDKGEQLDIISELECKKIATLLGKNIIFTGHVSATIGDYYPKGCFLLMKNMLCFNTHSIGAKQKESAPICQIRGQFNRSLLAMLNI